MVVVLPEADTKHFAPETAKQVRRFFPETTPLVPLPRLAEECRLAGIYTKDESKRQGQQAFKVNGASYAMAKWLANKIGVDLREVKGLSHLKELYFGDKNRGVTTFVTCTDGNHGR